jgi:hypothetical protein
LQQIEDTDDTFVGKVQERYGDKKDELMTRADQWHQESAPEATKQKMRCQEVIKKREMND